MFFRYQERFHLSYEQACSTPWEQIEFAMFIWSLDSDHAKLESERGKQ